MSLSLTKTVGDAAYTWAGHANASTGFLPSSGRLSRMDWLQLCAAIGLTFGEAEDLFPILVDTVTGQVCLHDMFTTLRADVAPIVSLERFATRVLTRYGSLQDAFAAICCDASVSEKPAGDASGAVRMMRWSEFHSLAVTLDVKDSNAERLWAALTLAQWNVQRESGPNSATNAAPGASPSHMAPVDVAAAAKAECEVEGVTEAIFVNELTLWAPGTALCALRNQVDEHFSDLGEFRHALAQTGSSLSVPLTPAELDAALLAVGVPGCNVERVCGAVQSTRRGGQKAIGATLDEVVEAFQSVQGSGAQSAVRDDLRPFWQKLHTVQADLEGTPAGLNEDFDQLQLAEKLDETPLECLGDRTPPWRPAGYLKSSASLPSLLQSTGSLRPRARRQSQARHGLSCCA